MTPPRLCELECPACHCVTWEIDSDDRGTQDEAMAFSRRTYRCSRCAYLGAGWELLRQSPSAFLLQPHRMSPMTQEDFDHWVAILQEHFPDHPALAKLGTEFKPYPPEQFEADRAAHARAYPVSEMRDQDGARRMDPEMKDVVDWLDMMKPGDSLVLRRRDGGVLKLTRDDDRNHSAVCIDHAGDIQGKATGLTSRAVYNLSRRYLSGNVAGCARRLRRHGRGLMGFWARGV